jgi:hypothetical protein
MRESLSPVGPQIALYMFNMKHQILLGENNIVHTDLGTGAEQ